jgi:hypothetical protein
MQGLQCGTQAANCRIERDIGPPPFPPFFGRAWSCPHGVARRLAPPGYPKGLLHPTLHEPLVHVASVSWMIGTRRNDIWESMTWKLEFRNLLAGTPPWTRRSDQAESVTEKCGEERQPYPRNVEGSYRSSRLSRKITSGVPGPSLTRSSSAKASNPPFRNRNCPARCWRSRSSMEVAAGTRNSVAKTRSHRSTTAARTRSSIEAFPSPSIRRHVRYETLARPAASACVRPKPTRRPDRRSKVACNLDSSFNHRPYMADRP